MDLGDYAWSPEQARHRNGMSEVQALSLVRYAYLDAGIGKQYSLKVPLP